MGLHLRLQRLRGLILALSHDFAVGATDNESSQLAGEHAHANIEGDRRSNNTGQAERPQTPPAYEDGDNTQGRVMFSASLRLSTLR